MIGIAAQWAKITYEKQQSILHSVLYLLAINWAGSWGWQYTKKHVKPQV